MAGTDKATTEATAPVEATPPAEETNEEEFGAAFDEFAAEDDTGTAAAPDPGPEDEAAAKKTEDQAPSGEESPDDASNEAAPSGAAGPVDIWADATPEQKAAVEALKHENSSNRTRASAQNRKINELLSVPKPAADPAAEEDADTAATPETDEDWEQFKSEYPEVSAPVEKRFEARMAKLEAENADLRGRVTGITDAQTQDAIDNEEALLMQRHPDYVAETSTPEFIAWLPQQPRYVQEGFVRNGNAIVDGQEAASLIDLFKDGRAAPEPTKEDQKPSENTATSGKATRRQRRLESAVQTESGQAGPGAGPPEGDFDASFAYFADLP